MQTIGLIGGMSWESSIEYYRLLNELVREQLGGLHSAQCLMYSVDFAEIEQLQMTSDWERAGQALAQVARQLQAGGADFLVLCTNTMHMVAPAISDAVEIPLLHIADPTAEAIKQHGITRIGLLGTRFTMEQDFYRGRLAQHGLDVLIPQATDRDHVHRIIYDELCRGVIAPESRAIYQQAIDHLIAAGAEGVILGCTEIGLLIQQAHSSVPLFDTTLLHAQAAVEKALLERTNIDE